MKFSAGPQVLGYLHQARFALYALLKQDMEEAAVAIEGLDDVEIQDGKHSLELNQLKHHIRSETCLTDYSPDLWKSLRIWINEFINRVWEPELTKLNLITTAKASPNSAVWYLKETEKRDEEKALELLLKVIEKSETTNDAMIKAFNIFKDLKDYDQLRILRSITVLDSSVNILGLTTLIKNQLKFAAPPKEEIIDYFFERVEGWWFDNLVNHLIKKSKEPITLLDLRQKIWSITGEIQEDNLPVDFAEAVPDYVIEPEKDNRIFVRQLQVLNININRIKRAILDYYRAFEQRSSWVRNEILVDEQEIGRYDRRLIDAWEGLKLVIEDDKANSKETPEETFIEIGREILKWVETKADIRIRPKVEDRFILRGSYHMLANRRKPRVYWHPKFLERLSEILSS